MILMYSQYRLKNPAYLSINIYYLKIVGGVTVAGVTNLEN